VWLDGDVEWDELAELVRDGYRLVAPKKLRDQLDQPAAAKVAPRKPSKSRR
jgi:hypothetical protein